MQSALAMLLLDAPTHRRDDCNDHVHNRGAFSSLCDLEADSPEPAAAWSLIPGCLTA